MAVWKADEPIHCHPRQGAHKELASRSVGDAYQHHLHVECSEMRLRILHPSEDHLRSCERVGDYRIQDLLREGCGKLPWWGEKLGLILFTLPLVIAQTPTQLFIYTMELFVSRTRVCDIRLHAFLFHPRFRHLILQPLHHFHDLLHGHFLTRHACGTLSCTPHSSLFPQTLLTLW